MAARVFDYGRDAESTGGVKVKEVVRRIEEDGWVFVRRVGRASHRIFKKADVASEITVSGVDNDEMSPGQLQDIRRKSGLRLR